MTHGRAKWDNKNPDVDPEILETVFDNPLEQVAFELLKLGVSHAGVNELLSYPMERIERQLSYMQFRKAKRPEAFIVEAIRNDYSIPKQMQYAKNKAAFSRAKRIMDEDAKLPRRQTPPGFEGHGTQSASGPHSPNDGLEPGGASRDLVLPGPHV